MPGPRPCGFTENPSVGGAFPPFGLTVSQVLDDVARKPSGGLAAVNCTACVCGALPITAVKLSDEGAAENENWRVTVSDTGTVCGLLPAPSARTTICALYTPSFRFCVFSPTLTKPGEVPLVPLSRSQVAPAFEWIAAV